jgi:hypothetical protein
LHFLSLSSFYGGALSFTDSSSNITVNGSSFLHCRATFQAGLFSHLFVVSGLSLLWGKLFGFGPWHFCVLRDTGITARF